MLGRPTRLDVAVSRLKTTLQTHLRQTLTEVMMSISLPSGVQIALGQDLQARYPESLAQIANPELRKWLAQYDPTPESTVASGAVD